MIVILVIIIIIIIFIYFLHYSPYTVTNNIMNDIYFEVFLSWYVNKAFYCFILYEAIINDYTIILCVVKFNIQ